MKNSLETKLGVFVVITVIAAVVIIENFGGPELFKHGTHISAQFDTVQDLKVGDRVKMAGVEIGRVEDIELATNKVSVSMRLSEKAVVKTDSKATIKFTGLMGQNFVAIDFGSPGAARAEEGTIIAAQEQPDLSAIMAKLDSAASGIQNLTKSFTPDTINNLMGPLVDFVKQNSAPLTATIANIKNVSSEIAAGQGTVGKLVFDETLYNSALSTVSNLQETAASARLVINNVNAGQGSLGKLLTDETLYHETTASMTNLNQILQKINGGNGTLGKLVNDQEFYKNAKLSLQKLDKAADGLEDTGPLSVIGQMMGQLF
ncbi:MAG: MlaD family protein [Verrucomicrobiae bacterium]|nr:MlaD family protein [Verrucomicrobiae bacterium]